MNRTVSTLILFSVALLNAALAVWELTEENAPVAVVNLVVFALCAAAGLALLGNGSD